MKDIPSYEGRYQVDTDGNVYSLHSKLRLRPYPKNGYLTVFLGTKVMRIHRLVALTHIPNPENKPEVNHKNGNKVDNRIENLEWVTRGENVRHARDILGIDFKATLTGSPPKLTYEQAQTIRTLKGKRTARQLAKEYNVSRSCILFIWSNRTYTKPF